MTKKRIGQYVALALAAAIALIFPVKIFAEESCLDSVMQITDAPANQITEDGQEQLPQVILPTNTEDIFDFILDPQQLIELTGTMAFNGEKYESGASLFFKRSDGGVKEDYSSTSDKITVINKGAAAVDVILTAKMSSLDGIIMTSDRTFKEDTRASLYLALTDGEHTVPLKDDEDVEIRITLPAVDGENEYAFQLTGAANTEGDWETVKAAKPKVTVKWQIVRHEESGEETGMAQESEPGTENGELEISEPVQKPQDISGVEPPVISPVESRAD